MKLLVKSLYFSQMKNCIGLIILLISTQFVIANDIRVGVYRSHNVQSVDFSYVDGAYFIIGDSTNFGELSPTEFVSVVRSGNKVVLKKEGKTIGTFDKVVLQPHFYDISIRLRPRAPILKERVYYDAFEIVSGEKGLTIINVASYQHYLGGVIESEGGGGRHIEYYKAQAVISRTYALMHYNRHRKEGFNLCDQVHCQAYYSRLTHTQLIEKAVEETAGIYIVDSTTNRYIEAYFHANCGGQTSSTDYVWREDIHYLQPIKDTFCIHTRQATWEKKIPKSEWRNYLINTFYYPIEDSVYKDLIYTFDQPYRKAFYISPHLGIPLRDLRYKFNLKSTFFSCYPEGNYVVLKGRGFGHGVGLCQEGAMGMANKGLSYRQILAFYYEGIQFRQYFVQAFFKQIPNDKLSL